jgi:hypothetical protein
MTHEEVLQSILQGLARIQNNPSLAALDPRTDLGPIDTLVWEIVEVLEENDS